MSLLRHIVEPDRLLLTWQPPDENASVRTRRIVGEIYKDAGGQVIFRYLTGTPDFDAAKQAGFKDFPAFPLDKGELRQGVIESLLRRLPPRKREDFADYLAQHRLPNPFNHSDMALLGYTGARLPSDGFGLVPVFPQNAIPCEVLLEIAGLRHVFSGDLNAIRVGDPVTLQIDPENPVDQDAVVVLHRGQRLGYVNRALRQPMGRWLHSHDVSASVERINGKPERPLLYVKVSVT
jgi:hypothetical protein